MTRNPRRVPADVRTNVAGPVSNPQMGRDLRLRGRRPPRLSRAHPVTKHLRSASSLGFHCKVNASSSPHDPSQHTANCARSESISSASVIAYEGACVGPTSLVPVSFTNELFPLHCGCGGMLHFSGFFQCSRDAIGDVTLRESAEEFARVRHRAQGSEWGSVVAFVPTMQSRGVWHAKGGPTP
jgi:hypothetical protein